MENNNNDTPSKKAIALNVPMEKDLMERILAASKKIHIGKAAYARMAIEEKLQKDGL